ncbi:unnamed protein product, partial [Mesorhabditis spiculigera]
MFAEVKSEDAAEYSQLDALDPLYYPGSDVHGWPKKRVSDFMHDHPEAVILHDTKWATLKHIGLLIDGEEVPLEYVKCIDCGTIIKDNDGGNKGRHRKLCRQQQSRKRPHSEQLDTPPPKQAGPEWDPARILDVVDEYDAATAQPSSSLACPHFRKLLGEIVVITSGQKFDADEVATTLLEYTTKTRAADETKRRAEELKAKMKEAIDSGAANVLVDAVDANGLHYFGVMIPRCQIDVQLPTSEHLHKLL